MPCSLPLEGLLRTCGLSDPPGDLPTSPMSPNNSQTPQMCLALFGNIPAVAKLLNALWYLGGSQKQYGASADLKMD